MPSKKCILIVRGVKSLRNGKRNPKEYPYWNELISLLKDYKIKEVGIVPLEELNRLLDECFTWIGVDSFFQHYAWYHKKKGIVIFGKSDPNIFGHKDNINILKGRNHLRSNQFDIWENENYSEEVFVKPEIILEEVKRLDGKQI
jgi:ADP-heptose:LPS heptosyltransferase